MELVWIYMALEFKWPPYSPDYLEHSVAAIDTLLEGLRDTYGGGLESGKT